jgi:hypothetical protein
VAQEFGFAESRQQHTPMETGLALRPAEEGETLADPKSYQSLLGSLLWLASYTRPDVSHAVSVLGQFVSKPAVLHKRALVRIGKYLLTTCTQGLCYRSSGRHSLEFFSDASYGDRAQGHSSIGFLVTGDNQAANCLARGTRTSSRTRHIDLRKFWVRSQVAKGHIDVKYVSTTDQLADLLTKPLPRARHEELRAKVLGE